MKPGNKQTAHASKPGNSLHPTVPEVRGVQAGPQLQLATSTALLRGKFTPFGEANLSIASSPMLYGLAVYTVFNVRWHAARQRLYIFRLRDHYRRLLDSARIMQFRDVSQTYPFEYFEELMLKLLHTNRVREDALVRVTIFVDAIAAGTRMHGLPAELCAFVYPLGEFLPRTGTHLCISSWRRTPDAAIPARAKVNGSYVNSSLMKNQALLDGYDDALALDGQGHVTESTAANVFMIKDGVLITPSNSSDILEGITRRSLVALAQTLDLSCEQRSIDRSELSTADEVFLCGSSAIITPVLSIDKRLIGDGRPGAITQRLAQEYERLQRGENPAFRQWLTEAYDK